MRKSRFVSTVAGMVLVGSLVAGAGCVGAVANRISAAGSSCGHVASQGMQVSRVETATYLYDGGDNTACVLMDDGNRWWLSAPKIQHDATVQVSFDDCGTQDVTDDKIVAVSEE